MSERYSGLIPVNLITGFLGSGKTTLLKRLLEDPALHNAAVIINEFGEIGLDHLLVQQIDGEVVVLQSGCICCTIRTDLKDAILSLHEKSNQGIIPGFDRLVIETTGLSDPAPIVSTLMLDPVIRNQFRLGTIVTTVDAVNAKQHLKDNPETTKQIAVADRVLITKTDLVAETALDRLRPILTSVNPTAQVHDSGAVASAADLLTSDLYSKGKKSDEVQMWFRQAIKEPEAGRHHGHHHHADGIHSFTISVTEPLDWTGFGLWMIMLLHAHGENILRIKGILNIAGEDTPAVVHGVQHTIHPPQHLDAWPSNDHRSRIIFIVRDISAAKVEKSFLAFCK